MSSEAISETTFLREHTRELHNKNAAVFAGACLSMASGYVDWKGLLKEIVQHLGLNPDEEHDLVTLPASRNRGSKTCRPVDGISEGND
jgi:hypothetical protein